MSYDEREYMFKKLKDTLSNTGDQGVPLESIIPTMKPNNGKKEKIGVEQKNKTEEKTTKTGSVSTKTKSNDRIIKQIQGKK